MISTDKELRELNIEISRFNYAAKAHLKNSIYMIRQLKQTAIWKAKSKY